MRRSSSKADNGFPIVLGNLLHLPFGIALFLAWGLTGIMWCLTIIGIPFGLECFKIASLALFPLGREVVSNAHDSTFHMVFNIL